MSYIAIGIEAVVLTLSLALVRSDCCLVAAININHVCLFARRLLLLSKGQIFSILQDQKSSQQSSSKVTLLKYDISLLLLGLMIVRTTKILLSKRNGRNSRRIGPMESQMLKLPIY